LVTPRYKLTPDLMLYARLASGYRAGGPNATASVFGLPESYSPDKTQNYEIGAKGDVLNHLIEFDASAYYIDWRQIQLSLVDPRLRLPTMPMGAARRVRASSCLCSRSP